MPHKIENLHLPFSDFFTKFSERNSIYKFGEESRLAAIEHVTKFRHVIDIGAHVGISVLHWKKLFERVTAFEPMVDHFECLKLNVADLEGVTVHNCAMSNQEATLKGAYRSGKNSGSFQLLDDAYLAYQGKRKIRTIYDIPSKRLDSFEFDCVDLIKIDVEGWEFEVLKGAAETIKKHKPTLMVEFTGGSDYKSMHRYNVDEYYALIENIGYRAVTRVDGDTIYVPK
jgi:FkbM family methyltransferase